jgi:hypothetical protein
MSVLFLPYPEFFQTGFDFFGAETGEPFFGSET